jgi:hypothetical protein
MPDCGPLEVSDFVLRANYPNVYSRMADARWPAPAEELPGYRPARVEYRLNGSDQAEQIPVRGVDIPILNNRDRKLGKRYLSLLVRSRQGDSSALAEVNRILKIQQEANRRFCDQLDLAENDHVIPHFTSRDFSCEEVSHKGLNLLKLSRQGYPVPDFCILSTRSFQCPPEDRRDHLRQAVQNLEQMSGRQLGSIAQPLILALRYAMPSYIPGLMPTYLNAGITAAVFPVLCGIYGVQAASKMYYNNLKNLRMLLAHEGTPLAPNIAALLDKPGDLTEAIELLEKEITALDASLLEDAFYQVEFLDRCSAGFFTANRDLIFTLSHGRAVRPALIVQQMICTVRGDESYPGVLYSRNPNTGRKMMVETVRSIFGEDIMTGTVQARVTEFAQRDEIKDRFPALYHFVPSLRVLEKEFASTVTAEFASETVRHGHFFALLQLNESELTGRAALVSAMDMFNETLLPKQKVPNLVKPFHFRQIMSDTIDEDAFDELEFFADGYSILPRSAISARVYFTVEEAVAAKKNGEKGVCLCQQRFSPSDMVAIGTVDVIFSLDPAAIHLVTTCRGHGTLAFLDLASYGVRMVGSAAMVNAQGQEIREGDWITVSSKRKKVYRGKARFTPARFNKYRQGVPLELTQREEEVFRTLETAFDQYQQLTGSLKADQVESYADLVKMVQMDLRTAPDKAAEMVNQWYDFFAEAFVAAVLGSDLGSHNKQAEVFDLLTLERKVCLMREAAGRCLKMGLSGMTAGCYMLGRFSQGDHPIVFWNQLGDREIAFLLNEWIQYRKYREVLREVGEHRIARARKVLLEEPERSLPLKPVDGKTFIRLKLSEKDLTRVAEALDPGASPESAALLAMLQKPYSYFYDFNYPWSVNPLRKICQDEGRDFPAPDEI